MYDFYDSDVLTVESVAYDTSATSVSSYNVKPEMEFRRTIGAISSGAPHLSMVLEYLGDMALEENEQIEKCLRDVADSLLHSVGYNSYTVPQSGIFPVAAGRKS